MHAFDLVNSLSHRDCRADCAEPAVLELSTDYDIPEQTKPKFRLNLQLDKIKLEGNPNRFGEYSLKNYWEQVRQKQVQNTVFPKSRMHTHQECKYLLGTTLGNAFGKNLAPHNHAAKVNHIHDDSLV
jgi:hypothetical protein